MVQHIKAPVQHIAEPNRRFSHIHVDVVGPLPCSSEGYTHLFTIVDRSTRWTEAVPLRSTTVEACMQALFTGWVSRFRIPAHITSDRGVQFTSSLWSSLCSKLGISHHPTTAYHPHWIPQANKLVERFHRQLKNSLRSWLCGQDWISHLPWVCWV